MQHGARDFSPDRGASVYNLIHGLESKVGLIPFVVALASVSGWLGHLGASRLWLYPKRPLPTLRAREPQATAAGSSSEEDASPL